METLFNEKALEKLVTGIDKVADVVKLTLGPKGRNVIIHRDSQLPLITNDGISAARAIKSSDVTEQDGIDLAIDAAKKTSMKAGDGTTTTITTLQGVVHEGMSYLKQGEHPMVLRKKLLRDTQVILTAIKDRTITNPTLEQLTAVASLSAESQEIGSAVANLFQKIGKNGVVDIVESEGIDIEIEHTDGLEVKSQYLSPYFDAEYANAPVFVTDIKISSAKDIFPLIEKIKATGGDKLVVFCEEIDPSILAALIKNKMNNIFNTLVVKVNVFHKKDELADIAAFTGAEYITLEKSMSLSDVNLSKLGKARSIKTKKESVIILPESVQSITEYVEKLNIDKDNTTDSYDKKKAVERIARITNGVAIIKVGAQTQSEMQYLKLKIVNAVNATRAAMEEGIVEGAGIALYLIAEQYPDNLLSKALKVPFTQILLNAGADFEAVCEMVKKGYAYNIDTDSFVDNAFTGGIVDSSKVTQNAVGNAVSLTATLLTTAVAIS